MKRPPPIILVLLLLATAFKLVEQPQTKALIFGALIVGIGVAIARLLAAWPMARREVTRLRPFVWLLPVLLACMAFGAMLATRPGLRTTYTPDTFATASGIDSERGFYGAETDAAGNRYVWTQERATVVFNFLVQKPVTFTFTVRSAAVAGGSPDPIHVTINGQDAGELRPDPKNLAFQPISLRIVPYNWGGQRTEIKLLPTAFKPQGDTRTLGTMVQSISVDKSEAWSAVGRRMWLFGMLALFLVLGCGAFAATRRFPSPKLAYGTIAICLAGMICAVAILALILRIGFIERNTYLVWTLGSVCIALCFAAGAANVPLRQGQSLSQEVRTRTASYRPIPRVGTMIRAIVRPPTAEPPSTRPVIVRDLLLIFSIALGVRLIWAVVVPPWQAPDEPEHFLYVSHIVEQKEIPHPPYAPYPYYPQEDLTSWDLTLYSRISSLGAAHSYELGYLPIDYDYEAARNYQAPDAERRSFSGGRTTTYSPLYYLYSALPYWIFKASPILTRLFAVRCGSAFLGALSCVFGYLLAYELRHTRQWGRALGLCMAFLPMYAFVTAIVNNDAAMDVCAAALIWLIVRAYQQPGFSPPLAIALGVTSGLTLLAKPTAFPVAAIAGIVVLIKLIPALRSSWQSVRARIVSVGAYAAGVIAVYGPWMLFRLHYYGDTGFGTIPRIPLIRLLTGGTAVAASSLHPADGIAVPAPSPMIAATLSLWRYLQLEKARGWPRFFVLLIRDFWGNFGWLDAQLPARVYTPIVAVYVIGGIGLLVQLALQSKRRRVLLLLMGLLAAQAVFLFIGVEYYQGYVQTGRPVGLQGRYLFPILSPLLFLLLSGWDHLCGEDSLALRLAPVGMACLQAIGLAAILMRYYGVAIG
jgi:hypothetical protein